MKEFHALLKRYKNKKYRSNYRAAMICSVLAEVNRNPKKRQKPFTPDDFMPKKKKKQNWKNQLAIVEMLNAAFEGEDKRGGAE